MFTINDDLSIHATRGDTVFFTVTAEENGTPYFFEAGDVLRMKIYGKKNAQDVVLEKCFPVTARTDRFTILLTEEDTKIGDVISKPRDYWYEIELNPFTNPQTIIGYDEDGAKVFKLFPEGKDSEVPEIDPEDIPVVDIELDMTSNRPVQNQAISRAIVNLEAAYQVTKEEVKRATDETFNRVSDIDSAVDIERKRIDNLVASPTPGSSELVDIRVGADGVTYDSAGTAVREQFKAINVNDKVLKYGDFSNDVFSTVASGVTRSDVVDVIDDSHVRHLSYNLSGISGAANYCIAAKASDVSKVKAVHIFAKSNIVPQSAFVGIGPAFSWSRMDYKYLNHSSELVHYEFIPNIPEGSDLRVFAGLSGGETVLDIEYWYYVEWLSDRLIIADVAQKLIGAEKFCTKEEVKELLEEEKYITCWGDSLTAGNSWVQTLQSLSGLTIHNGSTGGENAPLIMARQGANAMIVNNITIPAGVEPVVIADREKDVGITTYLGQKVTPLLQSGNHVNPVKLGDIEGNLAWTGSSYNSASGTWTFTRLIPGEKVVINRPTAMRTAFDREWNNPYLMIIFMGQNGGFKDTDELIRQHRLMIQHANAKNVIILGLSSDTAKNRSSYEAAMREEFGRYFISLREYLSAPVYDNSGNIVNCYGLEDAGLTATVEDLAEIANGQVPRQCLIDSVHYTVETKAVIGNLIYKRCCELGIF